MPAKVPQDVTREDKLIGPLTLKQFLYLLGGGSIIFIAYQSLLSWFLFIVISLFAGGLALMLAFGNINGRPFGVFLINLFHFITGTKNLLWHKEPRAEVETIKVSATDIKDTKTELVDRKSGKELKMQIDQLAHILDAGGTINREKEESMTTSINTFTPPPTKTEPTDVEDVLKDVD
jgi:hypothetical protein